MPFIHCQKEQGQHDHDHTERGGTGPRRPLAVSYTHLDVYKRQGLDTAHIQGAVVENGEKPRGVDPHQPVRFLTAEGRLIPVSYTHLL